MPDVVEALTTIFNGVRMLGDGVTMLMQMALAYVGLQVPDVAVKLAAIIIVILFIWKLGSTLSKLWIYVLVFLLVSLFAGLIPTVGEYLSGVLAVASANCTFIY